MRIHENNHDAGKSIPPIPPCVECGEEFTTAERSEICSYGLRGDVHARCCRRLDCVENDPWCE